MSGSCGEKFQRERHKPGGENGKLTLPMVLKNDPGNLNAQRKREKGGERERGKI